MLVSNERITPTEIREPQNISRTTKDIKIGARLTQYATLYEPQNPQFEIAVFPPVTERIRRKFAEDRGAIYADELGARVLMLDSVLHDNETGHFTRWAPEIYGFRHGNPQLSQYRFAKTLQNSGLNLENLNLVGHSAAANLAFFTAATLAKHQDGTHINRIAASEPIVPKPIWRWMPQFFAEGARGAEYQRNNPAWMNYEKNIKPNLSNYLHGAEDLSYLANLNRALGTIPNNVATAVAAKVIDSTTTIIIGGGSKSHIFTPTELEVLGNEIADKAGNATVSGVIFTSESHGISDDLPRNVPMIKSLLEK